MDAFPGRTKPCLFFPDHFRPNAICRGMYRCKICAQKPNLPRSGTRAALDMWGAVSSTMLVTIQGGAYHCNVPHPAPGFCRLLEPAQTNLLNYATKKGNQRTTGPMIFGEVCICLVDLPKIGERCMGLSICDLSSANLPPFPSGQWQMPHNC